MKTYLVKMREVWQMPVLVQAESIEDAIDRAADGHGELLFDSPITFIESTDRDTWNASVCDKKNSEKYQAVS